MISGRTRFLLAIENAGRDEMRDCLSNVDCSTGKRDEVGNRSKMGLRFLTCGEESMENGIVTAVVRGHNSETHFPPVSGCPTQHACEKYQHALHTTLRWPQGGFLRTLPPRRALRPVRTDFNEIADDFGGRERKSVQESVESRPWIT